MSMQGMRAASDKLWVKILMGVLIFSFVGWGAANWLLSETATNTSLIKIGSKTISISEFEAERNRQLAQMEKALQRKIFSDKASMNYFNQQILSNMTTQTLLEQHAESLGLAVSPSGVANIIKQSPEFWENGAFSTDKFDAVLDLNTITEKQFTDALRGQKLREMLLETFAINLPVPQFMTQAIYNVRAASRKIEYSTIKFDAFAAKGTPSEDNLREIYARNPRMVPEHRTISYIIVATKMTDPKSYDRAYDSARSIEDMLVAGDPMRDAARKMRANFKTFAPMTIQKVTANGAVSDAILTDEIMRSLFSMEQGLESEIIETKKGFVIFRVEKIDPAYAVPFGQRRGELTALWNKSEKEKQAYLRANEIMTSAKKLANTATVSRVSGAPIEVLNAAFSSELNKPTIIRGTDEFYVVKAISEDLPKPDAVKQKEIAAEIKKMLPRQMLDDYSSFLGRKYNISQNDRLMRRLFSVQ